MTPTERRALLLVIDMLLAMPPKATLSRLYCELREVRKALGGEKAQSPNA